MSAITITDLRLDRGLTLSAQKHVDVIGAGFGLFALNVNLSQFAKLSVVI